MLDFITKYSLEFLLAVVVFLGAVLTVGYLVTERQEASSTIEPGVELKAEEPAVVVTEAISEQGLVQKQSNEQKVESALQANASVTELIGELGKFSTDLSDKRKRSIALNQRMEAFRALQTLGSNALPSVIEAIDSLPKQLEELRKLEPTVSNKNRIMQLQLRAKDLIVLLGAIGEAPQISYLVNLAQDVSTSQIFSKSDIVMTLRKLGGGDEVRVLIRELYSDPNTRPTIAPMLSYLSITPDQADADIAVELARSPISSGLRGGAIKLGTILGRDAELLPIIKESLASSFETEQEKRDILFSLAQIVRPEEFDGLTSDPNMLDGTSRQAVLTPAQLHNQFWWASDRDKELLAYELYRSGNIENRALSLNFLFSQNNVEPLKRLGYLQLKPGGDPNSMLDYYIAQTDEFATALAGYSVQLAGGVFEVKKVPGSGWFQRRGK